MDGNKLDAGHSPALMRLYVNYARTTDVDACRELHAGRGPHLQHLGILPFAQRGACWNSRGVRSEGTHGWVGNQRTIAVGRVLTLWQFVSQLLPTRAGNFFFFFFILFTAGAGLGISAVLWCTQSATRFFEGALHMREQRYLIAFPTFLLYACFALMTIF